MFFCITNIKVNIPREHIDNYKEMALEVVKEKDFNSVYEVGNENLQKKVTKLFNKIEENTPSHELCHSAQKYRINNYLPNYKAIMKKIKEGMSVDYEKKVRDLGDDTTEYVKDYTLELVENYAKEFAQEIKGEHMDFIDEERLQER